MTLIQQLNDANKADKKQARWRAHVAICESKMRFETNHHARKYCKGMVSRGCDPRVRPYQCRVCAGFHLTLSKPH